MENMEPQIKKEALFGDDEQVSFATPEYLELVAGNIQTVIDSLKNEKLAEEKSKLEEIKASIEDKRRAMLN